VARPPLLPRRYDETAHPSHGAILEGPAHLRRGDPGHRPRGERRTGPGVGARHRAGRRQGLRRRRRGVEAQGGEREDADRGPRAIRVPGSHERRRTEPGAGARAWPVRARRPGGLASHRARDRAAAGDPPHGRDLSGSARRRGGPRPVRGCGQGPDGGVPRSPSLVECGLARAAPSNCSGSSRPPNRQDTRAIADNQDPSLAASTATIASGCLRGAACWKQNVHARGPQPRAAASWSAPNREDVRVQVDPTEPHSASALHPAGWPAIR
jgi:hypothetical protein